MLSSVEAKVRDQCGRDKEREESQQKLDIINQLVIDHHATFMQKLLVHS